MKNLFFSLAAIAAVVTFGSVAKAQNRDQNGADQSVSAQSVGVNKFTAKKSAKKNVFDFKNKVGLGFAGDDAKPFLSYDVFSSGLKFQPLKRVGVALGIYVGQNDVSWKRVDFGPQVNLTYRRFFVGALYRPQENRAGLTFGFKF